MAQTDELWSVLRYDLKTALEVVGVPCCLKLADNTLGSLSHELLERGGVGAGSVIKIEKELRLPCVRVRICAPEDREWFVFKKGAEFVREHARHVGAELHLPLGYRGKFRLCDRTGDKEYHNIREVVTDFPRFIRVEQDTVCASTGSRSYQVVHAGTQLELDRVTEGNRLVRGMRENYLVCLDRENNRELTFQVHTPGYFTKLPDKSKYTLAEMVERLPLPQTVESVGINPYDVISVDDDEAKELHQMLAGPLEILEVAMVTMYVGLVENKRSSECDIICIPGDGDLVPNTMVYIPMSYILDGVENPYCRYKLGTMNLDVVREGLYLRPVGCSRASLLKNVKSRDVSYGTDEPPDTPGLPRRQDGYMTLTSTVSAPNETTETSDADVPDGPRKRFLSTGDIKLRISGSLQSTERESCGIRAYLSQLTRRMKSSASQLLFGIESHPPKALGTRREPERSSVRSRIGKRLGSTTGSKTSTFICYINKDSDNTNAASEPDCKPEPEVNVHKPEVNIQKPEVDRHDCDKQTVGANKHRTVGEEDAIYAYIDRTSHTDAASTVSDALFPCSVCQEISEMQALPGTRDG